MTARMVSDHAVSDPYRVLLSTSDLPRRAQGRIFDAFGLGPHECRYRVIASDAFWRLRDYGKPAPTQSVLIVAAPIKRPYIWDLAPSVSAIRYLLDRVSMFIFWNGSRPGQLVKPVWQNVSKAFLNALQ